MALKKTLIHPGAGLSCLACGEGRYDGYVVKDPVTGAFLKAKEVMTWPCEKCGHQLPGQVSDAQWRRMIKDRDACWSVGKPYPDETYPLPKWLIRRNRQKIYIATSLPRFAEQQSLAATLALEGCELTFDWTRFGTLGGEPRDEVAAKEIQGVIEADFVVVLIPARFSTHAELGAALASGKKVFIHAPTEESLLGGNPYPCVFYYHPLVTLVIGTTDDLLNSIRQWRKTNG